MDAVSDVLVKFVESIGMPGIGLYFVIILLHDYTLEMGRARGET